MSLAAPIGRPLGLAAAGLLCLGWSVGGFAYGPPVKVTDFPKVDVIVVADGHRDEVGSAAEMALATGAKIVTTFEMYNVWFAPRKVPEAQVLRSNAGDWNKIGGITIRNLGAIH